ncbi:MAG TPA: methyltransferase domain-containing protein [Terrimicrobiaceae bacterium]
MNRSEILLRGLSKTDKIIEIGPSYNPLAAKRDGWNVFTVDHDNRDGLVAKYAGNPTVDTSRIEDVDYVWRGGSVLDVVPTAMRGSFDAFIASHVIEHTTDVISFLKSAETLARPDGVIILAVPDKRKCFDLFRPPSTTSSALLAYHERRTHHTAATHFDNAAFIANKDSDTGWTIDDARKPRLASTLSGMIEHWELGSRPDYVDAHQWIFVPASFQLMVLELSGLGYLDLRIEACAENPSTEFYAWLHRGKEQLSPDEMQARRLDLLCRQIVELAEQTRQMPGSPLANALSRLAEAETRAVNAEAKASEAERRLADAGSRIMHLEGEVAGLRRRPLDRILSRVRP